MADIEEIVIKNFGSMNTSHTEDTIPLNDSPDPIDVIVAGGRVMPRPFISGGIPWTPVAGEDIHKMALHVSSSARKLITIAGSGIPKVYLSDPDVMSPTSLGTMAAAGDRLTEPFSFNSTLILPSKNTVKVVSSSGVLGNLGGTPPITGYIGDDYNRMAWLTATTTGQAQFSNIDNSASYLSSDTIVLGSTNTIASFLKNVGPVTIAGTPYGIFAIEGFGRQSNKSYEIIKDIGAPFHGGAAKGNGMAFFLGWRSADWGNAYMTAPLFNSIYAVDASGQKKLISEKISWSKRSSMALSIDRDPFGYQGNRGDVLAPPVLEYDSIFNILYLIPNPFFNNTIPGVSVQNVFVLIGDNWTRWTFPYPLRVTSIMPGGDPSTGLSRGWPHNLIGVGSFASGAWNGYVQRLLPANGSYSGDYDFKNSTSYPVSPVWTFAAINRGSKTNKLHYVQFDLNGRGPITVTIRCKVDSAINSTLMNTDSGEVPWTSSSTLVWSKTVILQSRDREGKIKIPINIRGRRFQVRLEVGPSAYPWEMSEARFGFEVLDGSSTRVRGDNPNEQ